MNKDWCKNYSGLTGDTCNAGVNYLKIAGGNIGGILSRIPCIRKNNSTAKCDQLIWPTDSEIEEYEKDTKERMHFTSTAIGIIAEKHNASPEFEPIMSRKKKGASGSIECPKCKGELHYSIAGGNHHIWGRCKTEGCLSWTM